MARCEKNDSPWTLRVAQKQSRQDGSWPLLDRESDALKKELIQVNGSARIVENDGQIMDFVGGTIDVEQLQPSQGVTRYGWPAGFENRVTAIDPVRRA